MQTIRPTENTIIIRTETGYYPVQCASTEVYEILQKDMAMFHHVDQSKMQDLADWLASTKPDKVIRYSKNCEFLEVVCSYFDLPQDFIRETLATECYEIESFKIENLTYIYIH